MLEPDAQGPRLGVDGAQRHLQPIGQGRHQGALHQDREQHHDKDHRVQPVGVRYPGPQDQDAEQDRHRALEPGPEHEGPLAPAQPHRPEHQSDQHRPDHEGERHRQHQTDPPGAAVRQPTQRHRQPEQDERHDLGHAGQRRVEPLHLPLVGGALVPDQDAGDEHREETRALCHRGEPEDRHAEGQYPQRVEGGAGQGSAHRAEQHPGANHTDQDTDHHLQGEGDRDVADRAGARPGGSQQRDQQRDADRVVRPGLPLQQDPTAPGHLASTEHREHHRRIGRRHRGAEQQRDPPRQAEGGVGQHRGGPGGDEGPGDADPDRGHRCGPEPAPTDVQAAVEQDHHQRHRDHLLDGLGGHPPQARPQVRRERGTEQEQRRGRHPEPFADPVGEHCRQPDQRRQQHHQPEVGQLLLHRTTLRRSVSPPTAVRGPELRPYARSTTAPTLRCWQTRPIAQHTDTTTPIRG